MNVIKSMDSDYHMLTSIIFTEDEMMINVDNQRYKFKLKDISKRLLNASKKEREAYRVICSGYGINWPLIDEDLSIDGLIKTYKERK